MSTVKCAYLYRQGEAEVRWMGETSTSFLAMGDQTTGAFALVDELAHGGESVPLHRHPDDMESFYVLEGEITFFIGDEPGATAGAGAFVHIPGGTVHGFRIESETARYLILTTPRHGEFYKAITAPTGSGGLKPSTSIDGAKISKAVYEYGIEFIGPLPEDG
jgi:quercetin dioxygenase-like cupin family protein